MREDHLIPFHHTSELVVESGRGVHLYDRNGREYLDFAGGMAVNLLGHAHPRLVEALCAQAQRLWHCSNLYCIPGKEEVAAVLAAHSFADRAFFCNSGAEAIEAAIKCARLYHARRGSPERCRILACHGAFHGRTLATLAAAGNATKNEGFGIPFADFDHVPFGNNNAIAAAISSHTAAILVEPIQGEGGVRGGGTSFLKELRTLADRFGILLVLDEVQTGMGRSGRLFFHQWAGITPDILATAKGLGGGFPVGALLVTEAVSQQMKIGSHGSTFGGNPLAMAVAQAVLKEILAPGFLERVVQISDYLEQGLQALARRYPQVFTEIRGFGLMRGLRCGPVAGDMAAALQKAGLLVAKAGENVIRLLPPLIITEKHCDEACARLADVAQSFDVAESLSAPS